MSTWQDGAAGLTDLWSGRDAASPIEEDANTRATEPRGHAGARREHLYRDVRPVGVDLSHGLRRRPAHHLRPRRLGGAHLLLLLLCCFLQTYPKINLQHNVFGDQRLDGDRIEIRCTRTS